jgi:hypothetical protein
VFLSSRTYVTPFGIEVFRDPFQNIDLRVSPYAGVGYTLVERNDLEWNALVGAGYRYTEFVSVEAGEDDTTGFPILVLDTGLATDLTPKIELVADYGAQMSLEDTTDTNQNASVGLSIDIWGELDLDLKVTWTRVGLPVADSDGDVPRKDDFRFDLGLAWSF